jgi:hypothetical protein
MCEWEHRCQFKSICSRISSVSGVAHRGRTHKAGARMYARINRARSSKARKSHEPGPAFIRVGNQLALVCLFLGAALAVFVSGSFEQRIGNLLIFGLMPAIGFYATGHMLDQLLILCVKFCDMLIVRCSRKVLLVAQDLSSWAGTRCLETNGRAEQASVGPSARFRTPWTSRSNIQAHSIHGSARDAHPCFAAPWPPISPPRATQHVSAARQKSRRPRLLLRAAAAPMLRYTLIVFYLIGAILRGRLAR